MKIPKLILSIFLFGICFGFNSKQITDIEFTDEFGNNFTIPASEEIPKPLSINFLINNLDGTYFKTQPFIKGLRFDYNLSEFEKVNRNNFKFRVDQNPRTDDIKIKLGFMGARYYKIKIKRTDSGIKLVKVEYLYSII